MDSRRSVVPRAVMIGLLAAAALTVLPRGGSILAQERPAPEPALRLSGVLRDGRIESLTAIPLEVVLPLTVREKVLGKGERPSAGVSLELNDGEACRDTQRFNILQQRMRVVDMLHFAVEHDAHHLARMEELAQGS